MDMPSTSTLSMRSRLTTLQARPTQGLARDNFQKLMRPRSCTNQKLKIIWKKKRQNRLCLKPMTMKAAVFTVVISACSFTVLQHQMHIVSRLAQLMLRFLRRPSELVEHDEETSDAFITCLLRQLEYNQKLKKPSFYNPSMISQQDQMRSWCCWTSRSISIHSGEDS